MRVDLFGGVVAIYGDVIWQPNRFQSRSQILVLIQHKHTCIQFMNTPFDAITCLFPLFQGFSFAYTFTVSRVYYVTNKILTMMEFITTNQKIELNVLNKKTSHACYIHYVQNRRLAEILSDCVWFKILFELPHSNLANKSRALWK